MDIYYGLIPFQADWNMYYQSDLPIVKVYILITFNSAKNTTIGMIVLSNVCAT